MEPSHTTFSVAETLHYFILLIFIIPISQLAKMRGLAVRVEALAPALLCGIALILSFLCLFAGSREGFMEDYAILTVRSHY